jgi:hypothetical protein
VSCNNGSREENRVTDIFISYRTADEPITAVLIKHVLSNRFGAGRVFLDNTSIPLGEHFPPVLEDAMARCRVLIAVIGARWFATDAQDRRHVDDPADWVRREIVCALGRGIPVIPVLVGDVRLAEADLPPELAVLPERQFLPIRLRAVEHDLEPLIDRLTPVLEPEDGEPEDDGPEDDGPAMTGVHITFRERVDAPNSVFGTQNNYRR